MRISLLSSLFVCSSLPAFANGAPRDGALGFQTPATEISERIINLHSPIFWTMVAITIFVFLLMAYVCVRYRASANPEPANFSHNALIEIVWTIIPAAMVVVMGVLSLQLLYFTDRQPNLAAIAQSDKLADDNVNKAAAEKGWITIKAIGNQWNWAYEFPDYVADDDILYFQASPVHVGLSTDPDPATDNRWRNLSTDYPLVLPVNRYVRYQTAANNVIHSWAVPSFGIKTDAIPGRLNEGWFLVKRTGTYFGQCSEFCGKNHAYMPIEIRVVEQDQFDRWIKLMQSGDFDRAKEYVDSVQQAPTYGGPGW